MPDDFLSTVFPRHLRVAAAVALLSALSVPAMAQGAEAAPAPANAPVEAPLDLPFSSFFRQPVGPRGLEWADALRAADGRLVRLVGHMVVREAPTAGRFQLTPRPVHLSEHADGEADDLPPNTVTVELADGQRNRVVAHQNGPIAVTGRLQLGRAEDADGRVSWLRLRLAPDALADTAGAAAAPPASSH